MKDNKLSVLIIGKLNDFHDRILLSIAPYPFGIHSAQLQNNYLSRNNFLIYS